MANEHYFGTILHHVGGSNFFGPDCTRVVAAEVFCVAAVEHTEAQRRVNPTRRGRQPNLGDELRVHSQAWRQRASRFFSHLAQTVEGWPWPFGVHVVGGHW